MTGAERAFMREWLSRSIAALETLPPTEARNRSLAHLNDALGQYQSNVIPIRRAA